MASRSAAAEARRRKILERGTNRLDRITLGSSTGATLLQVTRPYFYRISHLWHSPWSANAAGDAVQDTTPEFNIAPSTTSKAHQEVHVQHTDAVKILQGPEKPDATSAPELCQDAAPPQPNRAQTQLNYLAQKDRTSGGGRDPQGDAIPRPPQPGSQGRSDKWAQHEGSSARHQAGPQPKRQTALSPSQASSSLCFQSEEWAGRYGTCAALCGSISESVER